MAQRLVSQNLNELVEKRHGSFSDRLADGIAQFAGNMVFVYIHTLWFIVWFLFHLDINLLTLIVSLEAIYLSTFIMINQNQQTEKDRIEAKLDYEVNKKAEIEIIDMQKDLSRLQEHLELANFHMIHDHLEEIKEALGLRVTPLETKGLTKMSK